jgi:uncharacterized damage-inducible protein DinB
MWLPAEDDPRDEEATRGEVDTVLTYLDNYRHTFRMKCEGLDAEQLARRSVPPSTMSLLGLMRHLAQVDHHWNVRVLQGRDEPRLFKTPDDRDHDFTGAVADDAVVAEAREAWEREGEAAQEWAEQDDWDRQLDDGHEVRDVMVHLLEEYARHCGHADLLRECLDGRTGF